MDKKSKEKGIVGIVIIILVAFAVAFAGYSYLNNSNPLQLLNNLLGGFTPSTPSTAGAQVTITDKGFEPATIQIEKGQQVSWVNQDQNLHRVASDPHPTHEGLVGFDSGEPLANGDSFSFTFENSGTYTYHDHRKPLDIKGTVIVK